MEFHRRVTEVENFGKECSLAVIWFSSPFRDEEIKIQGGSHLKRHRQLLVELIPDRSGLPLQNL